MSNKNKAIKKWFCNDCKKEMFVLKYKKLKSPGLFPIRKSCCYWCKGNNIKYTGEDLKSGDVRIVRAAVKREAIKWVKEDIKDWNLSDKIVNEEAIKSFIDIRSDKWIKMEDVKEFIRRLKEGAIFYVEKFSTIEEVIEKIQVCEGKHIQQISYSSYHNSLTQLCFDCGAIRTNMKFTEKGETK